MGLTKHLQVESAHEMVTAAGLKLLAFDEAVRMPYVPAWSSLLSCQGCLRAWWLSYWPGTSSGREFALSREGQLHGTAPSLYSTAELSSGMLLCIGLDSSHPSFDTSYMLRLQSHPAAAIPAPAQCNETDTITLMPFWVRHKIAQAVWKVHLRNA